MTDKANLKYLWDTDKYINIMLYPFKQDENSEGVILGISHLPYTIKPDYLEGLNQLMVFPATVRSNILIVFLLIIHI